MASSAFMTQSEQLLDRLEMLFETVDTERLGNVLNIDFGDVQVVINRHEAMQEIWFASPLVGGIHFRWEEERGDWVDTRGQYLSFFQALSQGIPKESIHLLDGLMDLR